MVGTDQKQWGIKNEFGKLTDVLLCKPLHFKWLPTSSISKKTLAMDYHYDWDLAQRQHAEMVAAFEEAGAVCHWLEPDPVLPYQVYTRDSSVMTPFGAIVTQMSQWWRRGEYAPVIRFYQKNSIPIFNMVTAGTFEGGDFNCIGYNSVLIGYSGERTQEYAAKQVGGWLEAKGMEIKYASFDPFYVHIDVMAVMLADRLAAVCIESVEEDVVEWLRGKGIEIIPVPFKDAMQLGCNVVALGEDRVMLPEDSKHLKEACRALGLKVFDPNISMFTLGGGGVHCMCQPLRRE